MKPKRQKRTSRPKSKAHRQLGKDPSDRLGLHGGGDRGVAHGDPLEQLGFSKLEVNTRKPDNLRAWRVSRLERPPVRRISEPRMNSFSVVVGDVFTKPSMQMPFVEHNHVVEQFAATSADPPFRDPVLPGASIGGPHGLCAKAANCLSDRPGKHTTTCKTRLLRANSGGLHMRDPPERTCRFCAGIRHDGVWSVEVRTICEAVPFGPGSV